MDSKTLLNIVESAPDPIIIQAEYKIAWMNPAACRLFGTSTPEELIGTAFCERIHSAWHTVVHEGMRTVNEERQSLHELEYKIIRLNGDEVWVESKSEPVNYKDKNGALIFMRDITAREKSDKSLSGGEERTKFALEASGIGVWEFDLRKNIVNRSTIPDNIFGYHKIPPGWSYKTFLRHVHPADRKCVHEKFKFARESRQEWDFECRILRRDGQLRWILIAGKSTDYFSGEPRSIIGIVQDITGRKKAEETLKSSYTLLRLAGELAKFGGWTVDVSGNIDNLGERIVNWSDAVADIHDTPRGYLPTVKEAVGFYAPKYRDKIDRIFMECAETGTPYDEEMEIITAKGKQVLVRAVGEAVREGGRIVKVQGAFQDISGLRKAEQEVRASEKKFNNAFHNHSAVKLIFDPDNGNILDANNAAARFYGWTVEELRKMNISQINTLSFAEFKNNLERAGNSDNIHFNFRHRLANGKIKNVEVFSSTIDIDGKQFRHSIIHDVTSKKRAQNQLKLLSHSVEQSPVSTVVCDINGNIKYANPVFQAITGYSLKEIKGQNFRILKSGHHPDKFFSDLWKTILSGKDWSGEIRNKKKNGQLYWEEVLISPILDDHGKVVNFVSVREDITLRKKMVEDLVAAKEKAEESDRLKSAFLANLSHEIRTPMNGILGFTEILKEPGLTSRQQQKFIGIIEKSGKRMLDTVHDLIDISKIETGQVSLHVSEINLNEQLRNIFEFFRPQAEQKGLKFILKSRVPPELEIMKTDSSKLNSILTNLLKNAIKFTCKGKIEVGCIPKGHFLEYYVRDTGNGVPPARQEAIFKRFVQADLKDAESLQGSGLGLAISKAYAELLGGDIRVESKEGVGSTFYFTMLLRETETQTGKPSGNSITTETGIPRLEGKKILVAEDDLFSMEMISYQLNKTNADLLIARDGIQAVKLFQPGKVDLVLLDIRMPGLDGYEVLRKIRSKDPGVIAFAQSAYAMPEDVKKFREAGFNDYLAKPFDQSKLYYLLEKYLLTASRR
jgi:PAS domain S-box-containing protein